MTQPSELLAAYDAQLRGVAEVRTSARWEQAGPLWRSVSTRGGFVTYESLEGYDVVALVNATVTWFADETDVAGFEWKTRGHDDLPDLEEALTDAGFAADEAETVMVGPAEALAVEVPLPDGIEVRRIDGDLELLARSGEMQDGVFGGNGPDAVDLVRRRGELVEVWAALSGDDVVSAGRIEVVPDTEFAGLWGGATVPEWRGRGVYRALTSARARSALDRGVRLLHSDCTPMSRPILERSGLVPITTTTPYMWSRRGVEG